MSLEPGTNLGPYRILALLGAGGMGEVYRALDPKLSREVAIKVLPERFSEDPERLRRFEREARALAALAHPNILGVHDFGTHEGSPYLVMELLEGRTLRRRLEECRSLPVRRALEIALEVARGLAGAHEKGILHRDLKPENVFLCRDGRVKILDFGLAKLQGKTPGPESATQADLSEAGRVMGTVSYMSPEQALGKDLDGRSDLFSLGVILWEMLAGRSPFRRESPVETLHAIVKEDPPDLDLALNVPDGLKRILERCLTKDPEARFHSAHDLVFALGSQATDSAPFAAAPPRRARNWNWRSAKGLVTGLGLVALGLVGGVWGGLHVPRPRPEFHKLTFGKGTVVGAKFTPDGNSVVYSARWQGRPEELFITRIDAPGVTPLGVQGRVVAIRHGEVAVLQRGTLSVMPLGGGSPRPVTTGVAAADWDPRGRDFALARVVPGGMQLEYPAGQVLFRTGGSLADVSISPQGDQVAFSHRRAFGDNTGDIMIAKRGGVARVLSPNWRTSSGIAWAKGGKEVWCFAGHVWGAGSLRGISLDGRLRTILNMGGHSWLFDISPAGQALVGLGTLTNEIWGRWPGEVADHEESWLDGSGAFGLSSNGRSLAITEVGPGGGVDSSVFLRRFGQGAPVRIGSGRAFDMSRDGAWVLAGLLQSQPRLQLIPTGPGETRILPPGVITRYHSGSFFPDGRRILIVGSGTDQIRRLYIQDLQGGDPRPISTHGCWVPSPSASVSPDGTQVAAIGPDNLPILVPVDGGPSRQLSGLQWGDAPVAWSPDGSILWVVNPSSTLAGTRILFAYDMKTGARRKVRMLQPTEPAGARLVYFPLLAEDGTVRFYTVWRGLNNLYLLGGCS